MRATATDNKEAWERTMDFLSDPNDACLSLQMDSDYLKDGYVIVKLPYGENISLLYSLSCHSSALCPGFDLKYSGFYDRKNKQVYDVREPINVFFRFGNAPISRDSLKKKVIEAIKETVAEYVAAHAEEFSGLSVTGPVGDITDDAEEAFSKKEATLNFAKKIDVKDYYISERNLVDFIDNPDALLKKKSEEQVKGHEEELARLWVAHCASQKLLNRLIAEQEPERLNKMRESYPAITYEQALRYLNVNDDGKVHSITLLPPAMTMGAELELTRVQEMLAYAESDKKLFVSDVLMHLNHFIVAFDRKHQEWTYLDCDEGKVAELKQSLHSDN